MPTVTKLNSYTFNDFLKQQQLFNRQEVIIDLNNVLFASPGALVPLVAICFALRQKQCSISIILKDGNFRSYLLRSGFTTVVQDIVRFQPDIPKVRSVLFEAMRGSNPLLLEFTKIKDGKDLPELLNQIVHVLRFRLKYKKYDAFDIGIGISEVCQNTFDHNDETCGFIAMQTYSQKNERFVEIAIADYGVGLAKTLQENPKNPSISSDFDAIKIATQLGTSQYDDPTRGTGLHHLLEIAYKHEGLVQFCSGTATLRYRMDKKQGWGFNSVQIPGVHIALNLRSKKKS